MNYQNPVLFVLYDLKNRRYVCSFRLKNHAKRYVELQKKLHGVELGILPLNLQADIDFMT